VQAVNEVKELEYQAADLEKFVSIEAFKKAYDEEEAKRPKLVLRNQ